MKYWFIHSHLNSVEEPRWTAKESQDEAAKTNSKTKAPKSTFEHPHYEKMCKDEQDFDKCCNYVMYLCEKIVRRGYQIELGEFLNLVNVNGFYKGVQHSAQNSSGRNNISGTSTSNKK